MEKEGPKQNSKHQSTICSLGDPGRVRSQEVLHFCNGHLRIEIASQDCEIPLEHLTNHLLKMSTFEKEHMFSHNQQKEGRSILASSSRGSVPSTLSGCKNASRSSKV